MAKELGEVDVLDFTAGDATGAVIFLHGVGDNGPKTRECLEEIMEGRLEGLVRPSHLKMYFPSAPEMHVKFRDKVTTSWFNGERIGRNLYEIDCNYDDCDRAAASIVNLIEQIETSGIPRNRILLAGISQGGMLAQYVAFTKVRGIAGVVVMATVFPFAKAKMLKPPHPILYHMYGSDDSIIPIKGVRMAEMFLKSFGVDFNLRTLPNSGHKMDEHYAKLFFRLLEKLLPK